MQTPGESSRKHGPDVNPRKHFEKTRSGCKPRESLRKNMVRMQTPGKSSRKHGQDANPRKVFEKTRSGRKPQQSLRENTVQMQTPGKTARKHGQDANRWTSPEPLHSAFSNVSLHPTHVFTRILGHGSLTLAPPALNSTRVFSVIPSGGQFWGSRGKTPPFQVGVLGILLHSTRVFTRVLQIGQRGVLRRGGVGEVNLPTLCSHEF